MIFSTVTYALFHFPDDIAEIRCVIYVLTLPGLLADLAWNSESTIGLQ